MFMVITANINKHSQEREMLQSSIHLAIITINNIELIFIINMLRRTNIKENDIQLRFKKRGLERAIKKTI